MVCKYVSACTYIATVYHSDVGEHAGDHGCHDLCSNADGSFHCYCNPGSMIHSNEIECTG